MGSASNSAAAKAVAFLNLTAGTTVMTLSSLEDGDWALGVVWLAVSAGLAFAGYHCTRRALRKIR
jgi:hypothetical protein